MAALALAIACGRARSPTPSALNTTPPLPGVSFEQSAMLRVVARSAYVRVQERPSAFGRFLGAIPVLGDFVENWNTYDVTTLDFRDAFTMKSTAFLGRLCPHGVPAVSATAPQQDFHMQLTLERTAYHRARKEFRLFMTLRITGKLGTVIYSIVATPLVFGDVLKDPTTIDRALNEGLAILASALSRDYDEIIASMHFHQTDMATLESVLLAASRSLGRPSKGEPFEGTGRRRAIIIGVSQYDSPIVGTLGGAANDAVLVFETINAATNQLSFESEHVVLLLDKAATRRNVREALSRWLTDGSSPEDSVVIYFSGHGIYGEDVSEGDNKKEKYFLPVDYDPTRNAYDTAVPMQEVIDYFERLSAANVVMIFDACHAGAAEVDDRTDELHRFARIKSRNRMNAVVAAAKAEQRSWEVGSQGLFTRELVDGLQGAADADQDGGVSLAEMARHAQKRVRSESIALGLVTQEPVWRTNHPERAGQLAITSFAR